MRRPKHKQHLLAALTPILFLLAGPAMAKKGIIEFDNDLSYEIEVEILKGGNVHRQKTIAANSSASFDIEANSNCDDKQRKFSVLRTSDGAVIAAGGFKFKGESYLGACDMEIKTGDTLTYESKNELVKISFSKDSKRKGIFTLAPERALRPEPR